MTKERTSDTHYKETVLLPKTGFPMKAGLRELEPKLIDFWQKRNIYQEILQSRQNTPLFVLHDGPPFANGDVHMGTALNKILKDFVIKSRTMLGFRAPFIPGWDCHGLPIEYKVVKESKGLSPAEVRRRSAEYAWKYIGIQREQFRRLGVFGDWQSPYLTLEPAYEAAVIRAFARFVEADLVYRGKKPVYWSTGAQTALAEAEVEMEEHTSPAIYATFRLKEGDPALIERGAEVVIWTTTPWTLPANVAIALHPDAIYLAQCFRSSDDALRLLVLASDLVSSFAAETGLEPVGEPTASFRGSALENWTAQHPLFNRTVPLVLADYVTMDTGTGCVHTAPGHGAEDYQTGLKYALPQLSPVDDKGRFTSDCGLDELTGCYVFDANARIIELLTTRRALVGHQPYVHKYPYCWRSKTPVIFRSVEQFFIRIDKLRELALRRIDEVEWLPAWGRNRIYGTVEARKDWCISRQRSWGVPLPVFYSPQGEPMLDPALIRKIADVVEVEGADFWFDLSERELAERFGLPSGTTRKLDTLDVWIDSGVSHSAVLRTNSALRFPADLYLEATDQHRGWFQSSLMTSVAMTGEAPYKRVLTHGFVVDTDGRKLSKSKQGAYQKPTTASHFVESHGADIVRLWASSVDHTAEVPFSEKAFNQLSETYRRLRNTLRILLANLHDFDPALAESSLASATLIDRWILHRLEELNAKCRAAFEACDFHTVHHALVNFCVNDLSALYVDITKDRLYCDALSSPRRRATQAAMSELFSALCRLLAPFLPFTAEEAWGYFKKDGSSVHIQMFPQANSARSDAQAAELVSRLLRVRDAVSAAVETARQAKNIGKSIEATVNVTTPDHEIIDWISQNRAEAEEFFLVASIEVTAGQTLTAFATRSSDPACARCWRHLPDVGTVKAHPRLCRRCAAAIGA